MMKVTKNRSHLIRCPSSELITLAVGDSPQDVADKESVRRRPGIKTVKLFKAAKER